jgi:D-alanyl-lipoteichoic acid acyltransferase DltB (MBOAT superfamily)
MLFSSSIFILVFLPITLGLYYALAARRGARITLLILASLVYYGYWDVRFVPLLVGLALINWLLARRFAASGRRFWIDLGVLVNLGTLGFFKYVNFVVENLIELVGARPSHIAVLLPLGISFFVFQKISYLVDLRRGDRRIYPLADYCLFVFFFPQIIAGPIVRHHEIIPQFDASPRRPEMWENLARGAMLFIVGLMKKVAIADTLAPNVNLLFAKASAGTLLNLTEGWAAAIGFALQIYFDFSGYSDMAIGLALMFGFRLPFNFDASYRATSIREFWRRWHITLSRFLRDYVYIPLGGNRHGGARQALNVIVTMLLGGLWHGASWTFVAWGGLHGAALAANAAWARRGWRLPRAAGWALTMLFVLCGWVLFRAADFAGAWQILCSMAGLHGFGKVRLDNRIVFYLGLAVALIGPSSQAVTLTRLRPSRFVAGAAAAALIWALLAIGGRLQNEFIYFQF